MRTRFVEQRHLRQLLRKLRQGIVGAQRVQLLPCAIGSILRLPARAVAETGRMPQHIAHRDGPLGLRHDGAAIFALARQHAGRLILRQVPMQRIVEAECALLPQLHQRDAGDGLRHRKHLHQRIAGKRLPLFANSIAGSREAGFLAALPYQHGCTDGAALLNGFAEKFLGRGAIGLELLRCQRCREHQSSKSTPKPHQSAAEYRRSNLAHARSACSRS